MIRRHATQSVPSGGRGTELNKFSPSRSLSAQLFAGVLLSLIIAVLAFAIFFGIGNLVLDHTVYGEAFSDKMADRQFRQLQNYVTDEKINTDRIYRLNAWCSRGNGVYLTIYKEGELIYESSVVKDQTVDPDDFDPAVEDAEREYSLRFADGTQAQAFLYYFASDAFFLWMIVVSSLLAFAVFSGCFVSFVHKKLRYIKRLKRELDILSGGDLDYPVTVRGQDELSELAMGIDEMRRSILKHQRAEEDIRSANSHLVTAMSHDLRTPLTSLLAFLEMLDRDKISYESQKKHLIHQSLSKAESIKNMADKLFEYFLVYTSEWEQPEVERLDADEVMQQFWQEYAFALESRGYIIHLELEVLNGSISVNLDLLQRAFDNIYANLLKYAELSQPIEIACHRENSRIILFVSNMISEQVNKRQSTNIGLNTCRRILSMHNGSFDANERNGRFEVSLSLPVSEK